MRFASAYTFQYSQRPGTPAATAPNQVDAAIVQERYERLLARVNEISWLENQKLVGNTVEVLVASGEGRKDAARQRLSGRARDNRLVHFDPADNEIRPGDFVTCELTSAAPYFLIAAEPIQVRASRGGDAWERHQQESCSTSPGSASSSGAKKISLGIPTTLTAGR